MPDLAAVFQIGSLGDSIIGVPALLSLRELLPSCSEYLLVSRFDSSLKVAPSHVFDMAWKARAKVNYQGPHKGPRQLASIAALIGQLRYYRPRFCVYLMPSYRPPPQVKRDALFFRMGGVRELIGFRALPHGEPNSLRDGEVKSTEAYLRFLRLWGGAAEEKFSSYSKAPFLVPGCSAQANVRNWLAAERRYPDRRLIALCPYSNAPSKDIPDEILLDLLPRLERTAGAEVAILGGAKDSQRADALISRAGTGINACGAFTVEESAALLESARLAVCADSGPMHLAAALGTPSVIAFSRMNERLGQWFPLGEEHTILYRDVPCAGCRSFQCPVDSHPCMRDISADLILAAALQRLDGNPRGAVISDGAMPFARPNTPAVAGLHAISV